MAASPRPTGGVSRGARRVATTSASEVLPGSSGRRTVIAIARRSDCPRPPGRSAAFAWVAESQAGLGGADFVGDADR